MTIYDALKRGTILALLFALVVLTWQLVTVFHTINTDLLPSLHQGITTLNQSATDLRSITGATQEYVNLQLGLLRSSREQKAIQAGIEAAAAAKGTILLINKAVVPRVMKELDSLNQVTQSLNILVTNTDLQVNSNLLPQSTATIKQVESTLQAVQEQTTVIGADVHNLVAAPALSEALNSLGDAAHELDLSMIHVEEALSKAPAIASHIEKITGNSAKVSKIANLASIGLIVTKVFTLIF